MPSNADYTREYFQIIDELDGDIESRRAAFNYMQDSTAIVHHQVVASSFVPRLFNRKTYEVMKRTAETSHRILCKVIERYRADAEYRKLFDFDERLVELILLPRDYDSVLPFARVDTFLNEDDYRIHFCEFNGDGSAGMNENREITNSIVGSDTFRTFAENHAVQGCDLFMPWVRAFMDIYGTYRFKVENPRVALLNIGAEESKGLELQKQTYALLTEAKQAGRIHFVGNIEGREAITQGVAVLVTDGYTGNIFLKTMEGAAALFSGALKEMLLASTKNKVAALMLKNSIVDFKKRFDSSEVGGTALLGISQPVVKAHGSSNAYAFYNAIRQAKTVAEADIVGDIAANVEHMRWERPKPAEKQEEG